MGVSAASSSLGTLDCRLSNPCSSQLRRGMPELTVLAGAIAGGMMGV
jgi:hypothetical protein